MSNWMFLAAIGLGCRGARSRARAYFLVQYRVDVALAHDHVILAFEAQLRTAVLAVEHLVAHFHGERGHLAVIGHAARAHRDDLAALGFFFRRIRNEQTALGGLFGG